MVFELRKNLNESTLYVKIIGKVDTNTSVQLREEVAGNLEGVTTLNLNVETTAYISSAGLRVFLAGQKAMNERGQMTLYNMKPVFLKIFSATGTLELLNVRE